MLQQASPPHSKMPSVLLIPTAEIPFHFLPFPITQHKTLLAHVLTHPCLSQALVDTTFIQGNPIHQQLFPLYHSFAIIHLISSYLIVPLVPIEIMEALDTGLSSAHSVIFVLLVDQGLLHRLCNQISSSAHSSVVQGHIEFLGLLGG